MSEVIILDTHIWFWFITQEFERFPAHWREIIETTEQVGISVISCYEIALAQQRGRLELPCAANQWFRQALEPTGITLLPLTPEITCRAVEVSPIHKDPFDRLIMLKKCKESCRVVPCNLDRCQLYSPSHQISNWLIRHEIWCISDET